MSSRNEVHALIVHYLSIYNERKIILSNEYDNHFKVIFEQPASWELIVVALQKKTYKVKYSLVTLVSDGRNTSGLHKLRKSNYITLIIVQPFLFSYFCFVSLGLGKQLETLALHIQWDSSYFSHFYCLSSWYHEVNNSKEEMRYYLFTYNIKLWMYY